MSDPIEPRPLRPLIDSYSYHSPLPDWLLLDLDKDRSENEQGWMLGIDEAGRGRRYHHFHRLCDGVSKVEDRADPDLDAGGLCRSAVLGPMVYAAAYCPISFKPTLESIGFDGERQPCL